MDFSSYSEAETILDTSLSTFFPAWSDDNSAITDVSNSDNILSEFLASDSTTSELSGEDLFTDLLDLDCWQGDLDLAGDSVDCWQANTTAFNDLNTLDTVDNNFNISDLLIFHSSDSPNKSGIEDINKEFEISLNRHICETGEDFLGFSFIEDDVVTEDVSSLVFVIKLILCFQCQFKSGHGKAKKLFYCFGFKSQFYLNIIYCKYTGCYF